MLYRVLADLTLLVHLIFVLFVVFGGLLTLRWRRIPWIHVPSVLWSVLIEFAGWFCPLTPLENLFIQKGGDLGYNTGFMEHYIIALLYPTVLTRKTQVFIGLFVLIANISLYFWIFRGALLRFRR